MNYFSKRSFNKSCSLAVLAIASSLTAVPGFAQDAGAEAGVKAKDEQDPNAIIVTATRRAENIQDVGLSVTAFGGERLADTGVQQTIDLVSQVPGMQFNAFSPGVTVFNLRGVSQNDFTDQLEPPVAVYIDDAYVSTMGGVGVPAFDIARVEVLRGPQGTQFGRNATGGLVHYVSNRPTDYFEGFVDVTLGEDGNHNTQAAVSGPLSNRVRARVAGTYNHKDGWLKNDLGGDGNAQNNYAFRGQLEIDVTDALNVLFLGRYSKNDERGILYSSAASELDADGLGIYSAPGTPLLSGFVPSEDPFQISNDNVGRFERDIYQAQMKLDWDLGAFTLTSVTDYQSMDKYADEDTDGGPTHFLHQVYTQDLEQFSQELRLAGEAGAFNWLAGAYYLNWTSDQTQFLSSVDEFGFAPGTFYITGNDARYKTESWSVFAELDYEITDSLNLILGGRYVEDTKEADLVGFFNFDQPNLPQETAIVFNTTTFPDVARINFSDYALKAALNYKVDDDTLVYVSFSRGIKGPNFRNPSFFFGPIDDADVTSGAANLTHGGETLYAYEAGFKTTFADGAVRLNASTFYYDYKDYQAFFFVNVENVVVNQDATAYGAEVELSTLPFDGLQIDAGLSWLETSVDNVSNGVITFDSELPQAPNLSVNLFAKYKWALGDNLEAAIQFDMRHNGSSSFTVVANPTDIEGSHTVGNVRVSLGSPSDGWKVALFAKNIWNETYRTYNADVSFLNYTVSNYAEPRWFGANLRYEF